MSFDVNDFLKKLDNQQPKTREQFQKEASSRSLEKIYLNFKDNFGKYQIFPMDSVITDYPFVTLFNTREVNIPRRNIAADGQVREYLAWIKLLPREAYLMKDSTGRIVSSLTTSEEQLLGTAYRLHDELREELDARNNREDYVTSLVRVRNYTIFHGMCLNKWGIDGNRAPARQNFCGLFICTAKNFVSTVKNNIQDKAIVEGDANWLPSVYGRQLTDRDGYLMFSLQPDPNKAGYQVTATHEIGRAKQLVDYKISVDDAEMMVDPVSSFLGWQANREEGVTDPTQRRLFNSNLIEEAVQFLSTQLAAVRMAKSKDMDIAEAIELTTQQVLNNNVSTTDTMGRQTNDPMLADLATKTESGFVSDFSNNTDPFSTPPAAHIDPMTSSPERSFENYGDTFTKPDFANGFGKN